MASSTGIPRVRGESPRENAEDLDRLVAQRTAELVAVNRQLEQEVNEHRSIQETLQKQGQLTNTILQNLPVVAFLLDENGRFVESIGAGLERLGRKDHQLNGENVTDVFPQMGEWVERALSGESVHFESEGAIDDNSWAFECLLTFDQVRGRGVVGFAIDITERKQAEKRAEKQRAELAHIARVITIEQMTSGIAHELNQPLSVIVTQAEVTAQKLRLGRIKDKSDLLRTLGYIADEAHRTGQIIHRMRDFVRKAKPHQSSVDIAETLHEAIAFVQNDLRHAGITVNCDVDDSLPKLLADRIQVQQVLLNLILNAMEAIERAQPEVRGIDVRARIHDGLLEISVCDTGCGVSDDHVVQYFDTFYTTKPNGLGMGLAISRSIVEAHGGRIWGTPNSGRGATFTFTMPIQGKD